LFFSVCTFCTNGDNNNNNNNNNGDILATAYQGGHGKWPLNDVVVVTEMTNKTETALLFHALSTKTAITIEKTERWKERILEHTLEQFRSGIRRAPAKRVEFIAESELIAESKVSNFYIQVCIEQQVFSLHKRQQIRRINVTTIKCVTTINTCISVVSTYSALITIT